MNVGSKRVRRAWGRAVLAAAREFVALHREIAGLEAENIHL